MLKSIFAICVIFLFALNAAAQDGKINWQADYAAALSEARKTGKPVLLDFTAKWCAPCQEMEKAFWTRPDVAEAMKNFVAVKVDYDQEKKLVNRFAVRGLPYIAFSDPIGSLIFFRNNFGQNGAETLIQLSKQMPEDFSKLEKSYKAYDLNSNDGTALLDIADFYSGGGLLILGGEFYGRALRTAQVQKNQAARDRAASGIGLAFWKAKEFRRAIEPLENYLKLYPSGTQREPAYRALIDSYANTGNFSETEAALRRLKAEFPKSKEVDDALDKIEKAKKMKL